MVIFVQKERKKHEKTVLLGKTKLHTIEVLISKDLIDSHIRYEEFVSLNNVTTANYPSGYRKQRYELKDKPEKTAQQNVINKELASKVIMDCRTITKYKFQTRLELGQENVILTKEQ